MFDLASAADHAQRTEAGEPAWQAELAYWTGGTRPLGSGIPDAAIPDQPTQTTVPGRDFGHHGDLPIAPAHENAAVFVILYGRQDGQVDWLRAGEALSAAWLTATELGVSVLPLSAPIEVVVTRNALRRLLADLGHPYLVLRLGTADPGRHRRPAHPAAARRPDHRTGLSSPHPNSSPRIDKAANDMTVPNTQAAPAASGLLRTPGPVDATAPRRARCGWPVVA